MSAGFGFSVGDVIAVSGIITKVATALKDAGGASADYQLNRADNLKLQQFLQQLQKLSSENSSTFPLDGVHLQARACEETLQNFLAETSKFHDALGPSAAKGWHHGSGRKAQWALSSRVPILWEKLGKQLSILKLEMAAIDQCVSQNGSFREGSNVFL